MPYPEPYTGARAIPVLIGRQQQIDDVKNIIKATERSCLIYITGTGGIGKTRLVIHLLEELSKDPSLNVARELIDLYHIENATIEGMVNRISQVLDPKRQAFTGYRNFYRDLEKTRATRPDDAQAIQQLREEMLRRFVEDASTLSKGKRIIVALDTAEKLDLQHSPIAERLSIQEGRDETVARLCAAVRDLGNAVVILAGRPGRGYLHNQFKQRLEHRFHHIDLKGLTLKEAEAYFAKIVTQLEQSEARSDRRTATLLAAAHGLPQTIFQALHDDPTDGDPPTVRPIMLALALDLVASAQEPALPDFLLHVADTTMLLSSEERKANRHQLGAAIIGAGRDEPSPGEELVRILGWLRKGATSELLFHLLSLKYDLNQADFETALQNIKRLSFIKQRPSDSRLFLHDEMYDILQTHALQWADAERERVLRKLLTYYAEEIKQVRAEISELVETPVEVTTRHNELRTLLVEEMHYRLWAQAGRGFQHYFRVSEEAAAAYDSQLGAMLRAEMRAFVEEYDLKNKPEGIDGLLYADVIADEAVRWIEWLNFVANEHQEALKIANKLQDELFEEMIKPGGVLAQAELDSWHGLVHAYTGNLGSAEQHLERAIKSLQEAPVAMYKMPRWTGILACAYRNLGYTYSSQGRPHRAIEAYKQALPLWRSLHMIGEQANTLNNLSFELAEIGDFSSAHRLIGDALTLRQELNQRLPLCLSFNTLAEINIRASSPEVAIQEAIQARAIFEELGYERGRGMALRALAEAKRRVSGSPTTRHERRTVALLEESEEHAQEAVRIFSPEIKEGKSASECDTQKATVDEPIRRLWALIELGCVYRDWLRWRSEHPDELSLREENGERVVFTVDQLYQASIQAFQEAAKGAAEINRGNHRLDALINGAWLLYYRYFNLSGGNFEQMAQEQINQHVEQIEVLFVQQYGERAASFMQALVTPVEESATREDKTLSETRKKRIARDDYLIQLGNWESYLGEVALQRFRAKNKPDDLQAGVDHFALALACYARYSNKDVRQTRDSHSRLYNLLNSFRSTVLRQVYHCIETAEQNYGWQAHSSTMWRFLVDNFGPKESHIDLDLDIGL